MLEDGPTTCEHCGGQLRRVLHPTGIIFKGSGFYRTDSRSASEASKASKSSDSGDGSKPAPAKGADGGKSGDGGTSSGGSKVSGSENAPTPSKE